jgi:hypothetical protein
VKLLGAERETAAACVSRRSSGRRDGWGRRAECVCAWDVSWSVRFSSSLMGHSWDGASGPKNRLVMAGACGLQGIGTAPKQGGGFTLDIFFLGNVFFSENEKIFLESFVYLILFYATINLRVMCQ